MSATPLPDPAREPELAAALLTGWQDALANIPDPWLARCFGDALRAHRGSFRLAYGEVLDIWDGLMTERQHAPSAPALPAGGFPVCPTCQGKVWLLDPASGPAGQRALVKCLTCYGATAPPGTPEPTATHFVAPVRDVLLAFCQEHADPLPAPTLLAYALACRGVDLYAERLRGLLESTDAPTLYAALTALDIAVDPPPPPIARPPAPGAWQPLGAVLPEAVGA